MRTPLLTAALAMAVLLTGCSSGGNSASDGTQPSCDAKQKPVKATAGFQPVFIPVKITVNTEGDVDFSLAASWATPVGTIDLDLAKNDKAPPPAVHRLSVSYRKDGRKLMDRFEIRCARAYRVFMNGRFQAKVSTAETVIEAVPGTTSTIVVVDAESPVGPNLKPLPEYQALPTARIDLPDPIGEYGLGADFDPDRIVVGNFVPGGLDSDDADIFWAYSDGLSAGYHAFLGTAAATTKTPQQCRRDASGRAAGEVEPRTLTKGRRFCVITSRDHLALITLTRATWKSDHPERRTLSFRVQRWVKT